MANGKSEKDAGDSVAKTVVAVRNGRQHVSQVQKAVFIRLKKCRRACHTALRLEMCQCFKSYRWKAFRN